MLRCLSALRWLTLALALGVVSLAEAQRIDVGSDAQIARLRMSDIGNQYTIAGINNSTLAQLRPRGSTLSTIQTGFGAGLPGPAGASRAATVSGGVPTFGGGGRAPTRPFANVSSRPTVSPYLNLFNTGIGGGPSSIDNYNTLVRPQLQQQRFNDQVSREAQQLNQRVQQISAQPAFTPTGSQNMMATGHRTLFGYYSHFYPQGRR